VTTTIYVMEMIENLIDNIVVRRCQCLTIDNSNKKEITKSLLVDVWKIVIRNLVSKLIYAKINQDITMPWVTE
jgi:hypothetical protein